MKSVIKAVKKLKLWSKKRSRKKRRHEHEACYYPPPPRPPPPPPDHYQCHHCCSCSSSAQPSAPPLPAAAAASSWLEADHNYGTFLAPPELEEAYNYAANASHQSQLQEVATAKDPVSTSTSSTPSYHLYSVSVSEPVYGIPVPLIQTTTRARSSGQVGCVLSFGAYLFRCLCPCFHNRQVV